MKTGCNVFWIATVLAVLMILGAGIAVAQEKRADTMQLVREKIQADKRLFIAQNMNLTESEAAAFWPVYETYQKELSGLFDRSVKLIEDYAASYETLSDETAKKLIDEALAIERERLRIRELYLPRFRTILSDKKVARYYQLENKIQAAVNYETAQKIPLVE